jgi:hypothetical protein
VRIAALIAAVTSASSVLAQGNHGFAIAPDSSLTPGAVRTVEVAVICSTGTAGLRPWNRERDYHILAEYGLTQRPHPDYKK